MRTADLQEQAAWGFRDHTIRRDADRRDADRIVFTRADSTLLRVTFVDLGTALCLWGDIAPAVFQGTAADQPVEDKIRWIGTSDLTYAAKKWALGMHLNPRTWSQEQAGYDLERLFTEGMREHTDGLEGLERERFMADAARVREDLQFLVGGDSSDVSRGDFVRALRGFYDNPQDVEDFGMVLRPRIVWAHAACRACAALLTV